MAWSVMCRLHRKTVLQFLGMGHTNFAPDFGAGVFKDIWILLDARPALRQRMLQSVPCSRPFCIQLSQAVLMAKTRQCLCMIGRPSLHHPSQFPNLKNYHSVGILQWKARHCYLLWTFGFYSGFICGNFCESYMANSLPTNLPFVISRASVFVI